MWGGGVLKELGLSSDERRIVTHGASRQLLANRTAMRKIMIFLILSIVLGVSFPFTLFPIVQSLVGTPSMTATIIGGFMLGVLGVIPGLALSIWLRPQWRSALYSELTLRGFEICERCGFNRADIEDESPCPECGAHARGDR